MPPQDHRRTDQPAPPLDRLDTILAAPILQRLTPAWKRPHASAPLMHRTPGVALVAGSAALPRPRPLLKPPGRRIALSSAFVAPGPRLPQRSAVPTRARPHGPPERVLTARWEGPRESVLQRHGPPLAGG